MTKPIDHSSPETTVDDYWSQTRRPLASLAFLLPLLAVYEFGVLTLSGSAADDLRNGADVWLRDGLRSLGVVHPFMLPLLIAGGLLTWHVAGRYPWRIPLDTLPGMLAESVLLAFLLAGFAHLGQPLFRSLRLSPPLNLDDSGAAAAVTFVGAGIYEELLFRLGLLPAFIGLFRLSRLSPRWATPLAVLAGSLTFSLAHHIGQPAETFHLFTFAFRTLAGVFFSLLFLYRGFGIAVGCHAAYDLLVGVVLLP